MSKNSSFTVSTKSYVGIHYQGLYRLFAWRKSQKPEPLTSYTNHGSIIPRIQYYNMYFKGRDVKIDTKNTFHRHVQGCQWLEQNKNTLNLKSALFLRVAWIKDNPDSEYWIILWKASRFIMVLIHQSNTIIFFSFLLLKAIYAIVHHILILEFSYDSEMPRFLLYVLPLIFQAIFSKRQRSRYPFVRTNSSTIVPITIWSMNGPNLHILIFLHGPCLNSAKKGFKLHTPVYTFCQVRSRQSCKISFASPVPY